MLTAPPSSSTDQSKAESTACSSEVKNSASMSKRKSSDLGQIAKVDIIEVVCVCFNIAKIHDLARFGGFGGQPPNWAIAAHFTQKLVDEVLHLQRTRPANNLQSTQALMQSLHTLDRTLEEVHKHQSLQFESESQCFPLVSSGLNEVSSGVQNAPRSIAN